jgi:hypothetical protein
MKFYSKISLIILLPIMFFILACDEQDFEACGIFQTKIETIGLDENLRIVAIKYYIHGIEFVDDLRFNTLSSYIKFKSSKELILDVKIYANKNVYNGIEKVELTYLFGLTKLQETESIDFHSMQKFIIDNKDSFNWNRMPGLGMSTDLSKKGPRYNPLNSYNKSSSTNPPSDKEGSKL